MHTCCQPWRFTQTFSGDSAVDLKMHATPIIAKLAGATNGLNLAALCATLLYPQVPEIRGHVSELETPLEDFRAEVLNCYDATLARVAGIHQVSLAGCVVVAEAPPVLAATTMFQPTRTGLQVLHQESRIHRTTTPKILVN